MAKNTTVCQNDLLFAVKLMQHLVVPTFVLGPDGRVMIWNKACERLTNVKADEVLGTRNHWKAFYCEPRDCLADLVARDDIEAITDLYEEHSIQKDLYEGIRAENWCVMPRSSKKRYLAINAGPIYDDNGKIIAVVETLRDMTEQKRAEEALITLAQKDGLTGLANRRTFDETLDTMLLHAQRERVGLSLILCDVDHFKLYNDTYGHQKGDHCLKKIASVIESQVCRPMDLAARYGGEEFAVLLPQSDLPGALHVAERIRGAVHHIKLCHESSLTSDYITASMGLINVIPGAETCPADLIEKADQALYQAKKEGRNRVCIYAS